MQCPKCGVVLPDGTAECPKCLVVFKKLEESLVKKALLAHEARTKEPVKDKIPAFYRLAFLFFVTAALWFFLQAEGKRRAAGEDAEAAAQQTASAQPPADPHNPQAIKPVQQRP